MSYTYISGERTLLDGQLQRGILLALDDEGALVAVVQKPLQYPEETLFLDGIVCPGFVNIHTHIELSALRGYIPPGIGMGGFIRQVMAQRKLIPGHQVEHAIRQALDEMYETGTRAFCDIANDLGVLTQTGLDSRFYVHTFLEVLAADPNRANVAFGDALRHAEPFVPSGQVTLTPHAPYSASPELLMRLYKRAALAGWPVSIHLLESQAERELFDHHSGSIADFLRERNLPLPSENGPLDRVLPFFPPHLRALWVHLTEADPADLERIMESAPDSWFGLCPRANLYLHQRLPNLNNFAPYRNRICIGTDSLAGTPSLDILEDLITLQRAFGDWTTADLLCCATINGARFLSQQQHFGQFVPGARPGVVQLLPVQPGTFDLLPSTQARRIA